jgi:tetratricopeptide (TPR) repeat protein
MTRVSIPAITFMLSLAVLGISRCLAWYFFGFQVEKTELWSVLGIGTSAGVFYQFLPAASRKFFVSLIRQYLSSRVAVISLSIAAVGLLAPAVLLSYVDIAWRGPARLNVRIGSSPQLLEPQDVQTKVFKTRKLGLSFTTIEVGAENWAEKKRFYPLTPQVIHIPFSVSNASTPEIAEIEEQLEMAFFQFFEARYLNGVKNRISALAQNEVLRESIERLEFIYAIIRLDFIEIDLSDRKDLLLESFSKRYSDDPWTNLLQAAKYYALKNYTSCAEHLTVQRQIGAHPQLSTIHFFKGVCLLKASRDASLPEKKDFFSNLAIRELEMSESISRGKAQGIYRNLALPSAIHFQGIANYYRGRTDEAFRHFQRASEVSSGGLKARALNGLGYIHLSRGQLDEAEMKLLEAMDNDPTYPLARSNYGYVLMGKGEFSKAKEYFLKNASNERLKIESYRDVVLAKLALAHLSELSGSRDAEVIQQYEMILSELKIQTFDGVTPDTFRLANIQRAIAKNVYLSKDYYGLEIYALALLTRAYLGAAKPMAIGHTDARTKDFLETLSKEIGAIQAMVSQDWLNRPQTGWFSTIDQYQKIEKGVR